MNSFGSNEENLILLTNKFNVVSYYNTDGNIYKSKAQYIRETNK